MEKHTARRMGAELTPKWQNDTAQDMFLGLAAKWRDMANNIPPGHELRMTSEQVRQIARCFELFNSTIARMCE